MSRCRIAASSSLSRHHQYRASLHMPSCCGRGDVVMSGAILGLESPLAPPTGGRGCSRLVTSGAPGGHRRCMSGGSMCCARGGVPESHPAAHRLSVVGQANMSHLGGTGAPARAHTQHITWLRRSVCVARTGGEGFLPPAHHTVSIAIIIMADDSAIMSGVLPGPIGHGRFPVSRRL
jgi:hypothetical protein